MTIRLWRAVLQLPGQRVAASRDAARGAHVPAHPRVQPRHAEAVRACARREHATPPRATPARTLWLTLYAPFGRLQESPDGFYGTICSAETLSLIGLTSSVQHNVDICISGLSASGGRRTTCCRLLWRAPRNRERSIPAQWSLVAALCSGEVPYHTVGPAEHSAVAESVASCMFAIENVIFERFRLKIDVVLAPFSCKYSPPGARRPWIWGASERHHRGRHRTRPDRQGSRSTGATAPRQRRSTVERLQARIRL